MSVFTELSVTELHAFVADYDIGELTAYQGIPGGTDNTNYFLHTTGGEFVLTVLERTDAQAGAFAAALASHLLAHGLPCAAPVLRRDGTTFTELHGKPALLAPRLPGTSVLDATTGECAQVGSALAQFHLACEDFPGRRANPFTVDWLARVRQQVAAILAPAQQRLYDQQLTALRSENIELPVRIIHGDLFRDNVLFDAGRISGIIDLYYACSEYWLMDVAIAVNDWCWRDGVLHTQKVSALCGAYHQQRAFSDLERHCWPLLLRGAALRFWASRLLDQYFPRSGQGIASKPAQEMEALLRYHIATAAPALP